MSESNLRPHTKRALRLFGGLAAGALLVMTKIACSHSQSALAKPSAAHAPAAVPQRAFDPSQPFELQPVGSPIKSVRMWTNALAPNGRGGWNFITQAFELFKSTTTEFIVVDLDKGHTTTSDGTPGVYTADRYTYKNELRAPNGRIFFPESRASVAYYDPADETVKELGNLIQPPGPTKMIFKGSFGPDGMLYLGTETYKLPTIIQLDPNTLKSRIIGEVGKNRIGYSFAYDFAVDPPWIYVAVGENPWELAALNITTGESRILATRTDNGWMKVESRPEGVVATLTSGKGTPSPTQDMVWCVDGKTIPLDPSVAPTKLPFKPRALASKRTMPENPPELDLTHLTPDASGAGHILWRTSGGTWKDTAFSVKQTFPVTIDSLIALPDGTLLGDGVQYHGFFRYNPKDQSTQTFGPHGPSRAAHAVVNGIVYITGYPNGLLYAYDPAKPWHSNNKQSEDRKDPDANPRLLGTFAPSRTKYASFLTYGANGRLYYAGYRERDGVGGGVAYYDLAQKQFGGAPFHDLEQLNPGGLVVLDKLQRVIYSGHLPADATSPAEAPLVVYDLELNELERLVVKPGLRDTGTLFTTADPDVILGVVTKLGLVYRYDVKKKALLGEASLPGKVEEVVQQPDDHSAWVVIGRSLVRIDASTLAITPIGSTDFLPEHASNLEWQGGDLYLTVQGDVYRVTNRRTR